MQNASKKLHEALSKGWSCPGDHAANISLEIEPPSAHVRFELAWTCLASSGIGGATNEPLWLTVETIAEDTDIASKEALGSLNARAQTLIGSLREISLDKASSAYPTNPAQRNLTIDSGVDLSAVKDLCRHLKEQQRGATHGDQHSTEHTHPCLGFLRKSNTSKHFLFQNSEHADSHSSMSLQEALSKAKALRYGGISQIDRIHLAKLLAMAVLQYHSTPWLGNEWQSSDVLFFDVKDLNEDSLATPYLSACQMRSVGTTVPQPEQQGQSILATNPLLHSLGVMLIELAFERALMDMYEPGDGDPDAFAPQRTAARLANVVGQKMGVRYENVVKRCLRCSFGADIVQLGLDNIDLQRAFYTYAVCQLEDCYRAVAKFQPP